MFDEEFGASGKCAPKSVYRPHHPHSSVCGWSGCQTVHETSTPSNSANDTVNAFADCTFSSNLRINFCLLIWAQLVLLALFLCQLGPYFFFPLQHVVVFTVLILN